MAPPHTVNVPVSVLDIHCDGFYACQVLDNEIVVVWFDDAPYCLETYEIAALEEWINEPEPEIV